MLKEINLKKVVLQGFKRYKDKVEFNLSNLSIFVGGNGEGKSTLADVIAWVLAGKLYEGNKNVTNEFLNIDSKKAIAEVTFNDETGTEYVVKKRYTEASGTSIWLNKKPITHKKLTELIDPDTFLLAFNPLMFINKKPIEGRKATINLINVPKVDDATVFNSLDKNIQESLKDYNLADLGAEFSKIKESVSTMEKNKIQFKGFIAKNEKELQSIVIQEKKEFLNEEVFKNNIAKKVADKPVEFTNYTDLLNKKSEYEKEIVKFEGSKFDRTELNNLSNERAKLEQKVKEILAMEFTPGNIDTLGADLNKLTDETRKLEELNNVLRSKVSGIWNKFQVKIGTKCPICSQKLESEEAVKSVTTYSNELSKDYLNEGLSNKEKIDELIADAEKLVKQIEKVKADNQKNETLFNESKNKSADELNTKIKEIDTKIAKLLEDEKKFEEDKQIQISSINEQIKFLNIEPAKKVVDDYEILLEAEREKLREVEIENKKIDDFNKGIERAIDRSEKLQLETDKYNEELVKIEEELKIARDKLIVFIEFTKKKINLAGEAVNKYFKHVSVAIEKINEDTGDIKECFDVFFDGKAINSCSLSEKAKAGIEFAEMVKTILGIEYPIFIDNNESIIRFNTSIKQVIRVMALNIPSIVSIDENKFKEIQEVSANVVLKAN